MNQEEKELNIVYDNENQDNIRISKEGVTIPWTVLDYMWSAMLEKVANANHPNKILYRQGQANVYEHLLALRDNLSSNN